jgi:hypothetical protein
LQGDALPATDHVARHCRKNDLHWTGPVADGVLECAFLPRPNEDDGLSTTWLEFFKGTRQQNMMEVRKHIGLTPKASNRLAVLNVRNIKNAGKAHSTAGLQVTEEPDPNNPAHALIKEATTLADLILREALAATVQPSDIETY